MNEDVPAGRKEDCEGVAVGEDNGVPRKAEGNEEDPEKYASMCSESVKSRMKCLFSLRRRQCSYTFPTRRKARKVRITETLVMLQLPHP